MRKSITYLIVVCAVSGVWCVAPERLAARSNSLTTGLAVSFDYEERDYVALTDDPETEDVDESTLIRDEDDFQRLLLIPRFLLRSTSERDTVELLVQPELQYDLLESETDWNGTVGVDADRFLSESWQVGISNHYLRSDSYDAGVDDGEEPAPAEPGVAPPAAPVAPELSPDIGRTQYWRNAFSVFSRHLYREESMVRLGLGYIVLRDENDALFSDVEEYDRYEVSLLNEHRFSAVWATELELSYIRGDFVETDTAAIQALIEELYPEGDAPTFAEELSSDLEEYRAGLTVENRSIDRNPLSLGYSLVSTRYEEEERSDIDIHELLFSWRHDFSERTYSTLGLGPAYIDAEGGDDSWEAVGIAELVHRIERGTLQFAVEKGYDTIDFSGASDHGLVDYWEARFLFDYDLSPNLSMYGELSYLYEDRSEPIPGLAEVIAGEVALDPAGIPETDEYHNDRYMAGVGFSYTFWRFYTAAVDYSYVKQESDRELDTYDSHRILLTLSWELEAFRW
ncbi:hypothetical protein [Desulfofustis limnaeus]|uniref:DUF3570 domain-containing protein n=1 Tax=Desulfofustis limnaeus TaxID=2740163 RepID=A0ABN6M3Z4_9BACT|nr:hypothetical protein [Desulfofustis limnaeus]BDD87633.1 hypothetical protein DPPLL_19980 [Desulfofustis limnaeus]